LKNRFKITFVGWLFLLFSNSVNSLAQSRVSLSAEIELLKKDNALKNGTWSVSVLNLKKDSVIASYNSHLSLIPASTLKIITTGAALQLLGADFKFETAIQYDGILDTITGVLKGNIYIKGGGDPTLNSEYFRDTKDTITLVEKWARIIKEKGIRKIEGAVIGDASIFEDNTIPSQWIWGDIGNYYGAGASGLTYNDNKFTLFFNSGATGSKTEVVKMSPEINGLQIVNYVTSAGTGDNAYVFGSPYSNYRVLEGTIPANKKNYEVDAAIPDPALFCSDLFLKSLKTNGIKVLGNATTIRVLNEQNKLLLAERKTIYTHYSPPLEKIIYYTNLKSNNLYAEHLLKYISYKKSGLGKSVDGTELISTFWKNKGVDMSGFYMNDGSGLSRANVLTTSLQTHVLKIIAKDKSFNAFYNSLPIAGKSGSLGGLCENSYAENNLRAKSGYITRARGYCGYVKNRKGELLCFSVLANNYNCTPTEMKKKLEKILIAIAETE